MGRVGPATPGGRLAVLAGVTAALAAGYFATGHGATSVPGLRVCALETPLDRLVPFAPWFVVAYASMWLLWWVPVWNAGPERFRRFVIAAAVANAIAFLVFVACRDVGLREDVAALRQPLRLMYEALYAVDPAGNRFPSLHATDTLLVLRSIAGRPGAGWYVAWGALVIAASLLTKQHGLSDVVAGAALAYLADAMVRGVMRARANVARSS